MNTLFVNVYDLKNGKNNNNTSDSTNRKSINCSKVNIKKKIDMNNIFKYKLDFDILSHGYFYNNINLNIDFNLLKKFAQNKNSKSISRKIFESIIKNKLKNIDTLNLVFCKNLDIKENEICKRYITDVLSSIKDISLKEIVISNQMDVNDIKYINEYIKNSNINPNKLKILVALNNISDYSNSKMIEYISNYKYVDILKMPGIDKVRYKNLSDCIEKINNEYGSTIEITQKRNIQEYNIYLMYSNVNQDEFKTHYILRKKSKVINMHDEEQDKLNANIKAFEKNKEYIETLFNRIDLDIKNYSKNKLGALMLEEDALLDT